MSGLSEILLDTLLTWESGDLSSSLRLTINQEQNFGQIISPLWGSVFASIKLKRWLGWYCYFLCFIFSPFSYLSTSLFCTIPTYLSCHFVLFFRPVTLLPTPVSLPPLSFLFMLNLPFPFQLSCFLYPYSHSLICPPFFLNSYQKEWSIFGKQNTLLNQVLWSTFLIIWWGLLEC